MKLKKGGSLSAAMDEFRRASEVVNVQYNFIYTPDLVPNDAGYASQYAHQRTQAEPGWDIETGSPDVVIAAIGTGVEWSHDDLAANIWQNSDEIYGNGVDDDGNGFVDDVRGWDFTGNDNNPVPTTSNHETEVAGIIGAVTDNGIGAAGVAWNCRVMPLLVSYTSEEVAQAIDYASYNGAKVINMSFGNYTSSKYGPDTIVETAVNDAYANGVVLVATAGNDSQDLKRYPAALDNVIAVTATDSADNRSTFSNYGGWTSVAAPGTGIYTTNTGGGYATVNGTSFAAPYVAGLAGLLYSKDPTLNPFDIRLRIEYTADAIATDQFIGTGRVNVYRALSSNVNPSLYAVIKTPTPNTNIIGDGPIEILGTALGDSYTLEYRAAGSSSWLFISSGQQTVDGVLGTLDGALLTDFEYELRLTSFANSTSVEHVVNLYKLTSWDPKTGWPVQTGYTINANVNYADIDRDGDLEIVVSNSAGSVFVWHHDGTALTGWPRTAAAQMASGGASLGDIDGDGEDEIVHPNYNDGEVYAWDSGGAPLTGWPQSGEYSLRGAAALANMDGDGALEVIVTNHAASVGTVHVYNGDGSELSGWPVAINYNMQTTPAVGDIDGDGDPEVVLKQYTRLYAFHHNGSPVAGWPISFSTTSHSSPVLGDIDHDGDLEIAVTTANTILVYHGDGTLLWSVSPPYAAFSYASFALGDVDNDQNLELFVGDSNGKVFGVDDNGSLLPGWPVETRGYVYTSPLLADIDQDGQPEVIAASSDGLLYAWSGDGSRAGSSWPIPVGSPIYSSPAIADIDRDGILDIMVATSDGDLFVYEIAGSSSSSRIDWPKAQQNKENTGLHTDPDLIAPGQITDLTLLSRVDDTALLQWTAPGDDGLAGQAAYYDLRYSLSPLDESNWASASLVGGEPTPASSGLNETFLVSGLLSDSRYWFGIKAVDDFGNSSVLSNVLEIAPAADSVPPAAVTDLIVSEVSVDTITIQWTAVGDDGTIGQASSYEIRYSTSVLNESTWSSASMASSPPVPGNSGASETYTLPGLTPATQYWIGMKVFDDQGLSSGLSNIAVTSTNALPFSRAYPQKMPLVILPTGGMATKTLTLSNSGAGVLDYTLSFESANESQKPDVAIVAADDSSGPLDVRNKLVQTGLLNSVTILTANTMTPTLAQLQAFDSLLIYSQYGYQDGVTLGNVMADYVDAGGGVVAAIFEVNSAPCCTMQGRWTSEEYNVFVRGGWVRDTRAYLGTVYAPGHPILNNVVSFDGGSISFRPSTYDLTAGAERVADWTDGHPLVATKTVHGSKRVDLGFYPKSSDVSAGNWNSATDGDLLMANALSWVAATPAPPPWLSLDPVSGTVPAGGSQSFTLTYDASTLTAGTYETDIVIQTNDPMNQTITVPVALEVCADDDGDSICNTYDICPGYDDHLDFDDDGRPDGCDPFDDDGSEWRDSDNDTVGDNRDNCPYISNPGQIDFDSDAQGDACDRTPDIADFGTVIDAPHNKTRGITCAMCHSYSLWWQHSPAMKNDAFDNTIVNAVCDQCHEAGCGTRASNAPAASEAMGGIYKTGQNDDWSITCVDCHDPHKQAQLDWLGSDRSELYLIEGTITGNFQVQGGLTSFSYRLDGSKPEWADPALWERKNDIALPNGLILVDDASQAKNSYEIVSADATTITVKGGVDQALTGQAFGLGYGQLIKSKIITPSAGVRDVKYFNPKAPAGGFTDGNTPVTGLCQVCHENTQFWDANGLWLDSPLHPGAGNLQCTNCHFPARLP